MKKHIVVLMGLLFVLQAVGEESKFDQAFKRVVTDLPELTVKQSLAVAAGGVSLWFLSAVAFAHVPFYVHTTYAIPKEFFDKHGITFQTVSSAVASGNYSKIKSSYLSYNEGCVVFEGKTMNPIKGYRNASRIRAWNVEEKEFRLDSNPSQIYYKVNILSWTHTLLTTPSYTATIAGMVGGFSLYLYGFLYGALHAAEYFSEQKLLPLSLHS